MTFNLEEEQGDVSGDWLLITTEDLPPLPHVAARVFSVVRDPSSSARDLEQVIQSDQALTQRLLRTANSALFAGNVKTQDLRGAITRLGFNRIKNLALIASAKDVFQTGNEIANLLWRHSLGTGIACRLLGEIVDAPDLEDLFLAGLFHDVGQVLMNNQKPRRYEQIVQTALDQRRPVTAVEEEVFRFSHEEVGVLAIRKWGLPDSLLSPIQNHHRIQQEDGDPIDDEARVAVVATADLITTMLNIGILTSIAVDPVGARSTQLLGLEPDAILAVVEKVPEIFLKQVEIFF